MQASGRVKVSYIDIQGVSDKGISVGGASRFIGNHIVVRDALVGVVCKDASIMDIYHLQLDDIKLYGLMTYVKQPSLGLPVMRVQDPQIRAVRRLALSQMGSAYYRR